MDLVQTKIMGLTMQLDLKAKEYKMLCEKLEKAKKRITDQNDKRLLWFKDMFLKNHNEIVEINEQLKELQKNEINNEKKYNLDEAFQRKNQEQIKEENYQEQAESNTVAMVEHKESIFTKILNKIKNIFH